MSDAEKRKRVEELKREINKTKTEYDFYKAMQLALKTVLNGTYGSVCHKAFSLSNTDIANSITALAREVINYMLDNIEDYFYNKWGMDKAIHDLLGCAFISIGQDKKYYYHRIDGKLIDNYGRDKEEEIFNAYHLDQSDIVESDKKEFIVDEKTYNIIKKIFICDFSNITPISTKYKIEPNLKSTQFDEMRGVREEPLIIYGDTDSLYISFTPIMNSVGYDGDGYDAGLKFILHINGCFIKFLFNEFLETYAKSYGVKNLHDFELETINKSGLHIQKKHYINNVVYEDGVFYEDLSYLYPKGIEIVKSSTPVFVRENIWDFIRYLFKNPGNLNIRDILKMVKDMKKLFKEAPKEDISMTTSCTNYESKVINDQTGLECVKGAHFSIKAAALHNYILNKNSDYKTRFSTIKGGKIKYYFCEHPLNDKFAYLRSFHPSELCIKENIQVDYDEQFYKTFITICNRFLEPIGLPHINKRLSVLNSLFTTKKLTPIETEKEDFDDYNDEDDIIRRNKEFDEFIDDVKNEEEQKEDFDPFWG